MYQPVHGTQQRTFHRDVNIGRHAAGGAGQLLPGDVLGVAADPPQRRGRRLPGQPPQIALQLVLDDALGDLDIVHETLRSGGRFVTQVREVEEPDRRERSDVRVDVARQRQVDEREASGCVWASRSRAS
ncbi:MAG TPA: hypothetical protein VKB59_04965, partial [Micromonosporaceae bacterium]|nr:hypothetical protein [Micromonosporaceae bacterium]